MTGIKINQIKKIHFQKFLWGFFRFVLIFGLCYVILNPFIIKILMSFMGPKDLLDSTIKLIPKHWSLYYWKYAWGKLDIANSGMLTMQLSMISGLIQMLVSTSVGYGLARFKFKGRNLAFAMVIIMLLIPPQVYSIAQYLGFRYFGFGAVTANLIDTVFPVYILSFCCLSIKQGLYIFLLREFFMGMPKDLENAAYVDGASVFRTFFSVMLPNAKTMMITIFLFAFCWQWTDTSFSSLYFSSRVTLALRPMLGAMTIRTQARTDIYGTGIAINTATMIVIIPLIILAVVCQKFLVKSISQSGLAN